MKLNRPLDQLMDHQPELYEFHSPMEEWDRIYLKFDQSLRQLTVGWEKVYSNQLEILDVE